MSNDEWGTPQWLFDKLDEEFGFDLDVCASKENHKCPHYFDIEDDGLKQNWNERNFCNPPYSNQLPWGIKAAGQASHGKLTVMLAMCDTSTNFFSYCVSHADQIRLLTHRIQFEGAKGSPRFASMIVVFGSRIWQPKLYRNAEITLADYRVFKV